MNEEHTHVCSCHGGPPANPECLQRLNEVRSVVFGNGHPEKSLLVRMERVEQRLAAIQRLSLATLCGVGTLLVRLLGSWLEALTRGS